MSIRYEQKDAHLVEYLKELNYLTGGQKDSCGVNLTLIIFTPPKKNMSSDVI
jgi:hypothetical protein